MPQSGPVYQPTTVSYERPGLLSHNSGSPMKYLRRPMPQIAILILALVSLAAGIAMIVSGTADYVDTEQHKEELAVLPPTEGMDIAMIVSGVAVLLFSLAMAFLYVRLARYRRDWGCPCGGMSKKQGLARQLQGDCGSINGGGGGGSGAGGPIIALNPSTDPLVTHTQYAPVSEIPMRLEFEERHTLMPANSNNNSNTNKESASGGGATSGAEESERMLADTNDSRIVLRPIGHVEDA